LLHRSNSQGYGPSGSNLIPPRSAPAPVAARKCMDVAAYAAQHQDRSPTRVLENEGDIGTGPMEAQCKKPTTRPVKGARACAGLGKTPMRSWCRALYKSHQWDQGLKHRCHNELSGSPNKKAHPGDFALPVTMFIAKSWCCRCACTAIRRPHIPRRIQPLLAPTARGRIECSGPCPTPSVTGSYPVRPGDQVSSRAPPIRSAPVRPLGPVKAPAANAPSSPPALPRQ